MDFPHRHPFLTALASVILLWLALPPGGVWWLGFLAPVPWIMLIFDQRRPKRLYRSLYACGFIFWLFEVHFVRYPHPINNVLLLLLAGYMGVYLPIFVAVSRNLVHGIFPRLFVGKISPAVATLLAAPVIYMACDILRGWVLTGYLMGSLCHTLYRVPVLIQTADIMGEVGVSGLMVFTAAALAILISRRNLKMLIPLALAPAIMYGYGMMRMTERTPVRMPYSAYPDPWPARIALIQGNIPAVVEVDDKTREATERQYFGMMWEVADRRRPDLIVLPESMYRRDVIFAEPDAACPPGVKDENDVPYTEDTFRQRLAEIAPRTQENLQSIPDALGIPLVTGGSVTVYKKSGPEHYNTALYVWPRNQGIDLYKIQGIDFYAKMHLVPFGEYVPFLRALAKWFPGAESLSPIGAGGGVGETPRVFRIAVGNGREHLNASANICFESTVGRLIRRQVATLTQNHQTPDILLNISNNGWFRNSHETQLHLACGVFRAVENRRKLLIAANFGISAEIDENGVILQEAPHGQPHVLIASAEKWSGRRSLYTEYGWLTIWLPMVFFAVGCVRQRTAEQRISPV